ncbi:MAG: InlB B-repeat-containing protein [Paludibacteraceae bacterium]|nr:InlB B-repeat-containing protein [Paludibacteraceae bacterium]
MNYSTEVGDAPSKTETTTTFGANVDNKTFDAEIGGTFETKTATVSAGATSVTSPMISYSSSVPAVASVDANTGAITIIAKGTTDITATYAGNDTYAESSAKYTINVTNPNEKVLWSEDWSSEKTDGYTLVNGGSTTKLYNETSAGGTSPELLVSKSGGSLTNSSISLLGSTGPYILTFKANNNKLSVSSSTEGVEVSDISLVSGKTYTCTITVPAKTESIALTFSNSTSNNTRLDDIELIGTAAAITYSIEFDGNGATSGSMDAIEGIEPNSSETLPANAFVKKGYDFTGWKDQDDNSYADEATIPNISKNITLTAQWTAKVLDITLDKNGSSENGLAQITYDATSIADGDFSPVEAWAGHNLLGYYTLSENGDKVLNIDGTFAGNVTGWIVDDKWAKDENATLYAQWETTAQYSIAYDLTGCTADAGNPENIALEATSATLNFDLAAGYVWTAAAIEVTMGGVELAATEYTFTDGELVINPNDGFNGNIEVTIVCDYAFVVLTLSENGSTSTKDGKLNTAITLPTTSIQACEGKVFVGWSENPIEGEVGKDQVTLLGETYTFTNPAVLAKTIYAVYAKKTEGTAQTIFSENFDACEGTGGNDEKWSGSIASATLPSSITGWTFTKGNAANQCAKFGSSSAAGSAQTPALEFTGKATLTFRAGAWSGDAKTLNITTTSGKVTPTSITLADAAFTSYEIVITDATENPQITIAAAQASKNRFFLDDVVVKAAGEPTYSNYCTICQAAVAAPTFDPDGGTFTSKQSIELTATEGDIYYTINDGAETLYEEEIVLSKRGTYKISAYAKVDDRTSETVTKTYTLDWAYTLEELVDEGAPTTAGREVTVILTDEVIESLATSGSYVNGFFTMVGDKKIEVYCQNSPSDWEVGGKVSGTVVDGTWKDYKGTWELMPTNWDWASYTAPAKITSLKITGDVTNKNYTAGQKLDFTGLTVKGVYSDNTEQNPHMEDVTEDVAWTEIILTENQINATATATLNNVKTGNQDVKETKSISGLTVGAKVELSKIEITTEASKKDFFVGRNFNHEGIVVTATYTNATTSNVTNACQFSTPTLANKGQETITITYSEGEGQDKKEVTTSYTINVKYMNLSDLVAEDIPTNTSVKVAFSDVEITGFYTNSSDKRTGVYVNVIGKNGANIELYSGGTPSATLNDWQEGGLISSKGDYITGTWKYYDGGSVWEIDFGSNYAWSTNIEYTAPEIYPTEISMSIPTATVKQSKSLDLEATFMPANATILNNLAWSSDNTDVTVVPSQDKKSAIVTVAPDATVGTATITVKVDDKDGNELSATCDITIEEYTAPKYGLYNGAIREGDYIFKADGKYYFMNNTISSNRLANVAATDDPEIINNVITTEVETYVWHIAKSGDYWTIQNLANNKYAAGTSTKNQAQLLEACTDNMAKWTITYDEEKDVYTFENLGRSQASSDSNNKYLRNNDNSGWACYGSSTGNAITLYKAGFTPAAALTSIEIQGTLTSKCFQGKSVRYNGLSVLGHYSDNTSAPITEGIVWSANPTSFTELGEQTVTITATVQTKSGEVKDDAEFNVTVVAPVVADYVLVEDVNDLNDGAAIILGAVFGTEAKPIYAVNQGFNSKYLDAYRSNDEGSDLEYADKTMKTANASEITLKKVESGWKLMDENGKYIISNNSDIALSENADEATVWTITITEGVAEIASGSNIIYYNTSNPRFKTYTNPQQEIGIYMKPFVTVRENLTVGSYGTVCWQKDVVAYTGATFYQADYKDEGAHEMYFNKVDDGEKLNAGQAYLFCATDATIQFMEGSEQALDPISGTAARGFYGVFADDFCPADYAWYGVYGTKIQPMAKDAGVPANRAYIKLDEVPTESYVEAGAPAPRRLAMVMPKSTATDLYLIYNPEEGARKVMMNNHVMIIRNNRMYNAQGQFMKVNK